MEQFTAPQRLPPSSSRHSVFRPLPSSYVQAWAKDIVAALPPAAMGIIPHADIFLLEVCFAMQDAQQDFLDSDFTCKHFTVCPVPPTGTPSRFVPIKLVNMPVLTPLVIENQLQTLWAPYGDIVALAPHKYTGTSLLSNCWDMVLRLPVGKTLSAPPLFELLGFKVLASWPGSDKACP